MADAAPTCRVRRATDWDAGNWVYSNGWHPDSTAAKREAASLPPEMTLSRGDHLASQATRTALALVCVVAAYVCARTVGGWVLGSSVAAAP